MKTFQEAFMAALVTTDPSDDSITAKNLEQQAEEIASDHNARRWAHEVALIMWMKIGEEIDILDFEDALLSGMVSGVRIGIEMEKQDVKGEVCS